MILPLGKKKRLDRIFRDNGKTFIVPMDDLLICGADYQLSNYKEKIALLGEMGVDAVLGFPGVFNQFYSELKNKSWIMNMTTSTMRQDHTNKALSFTLKNAVSMGCDAVAVHVNITSPTEGKMIQNLAMLSCECQEVGMPLLAIIYARKPGDKGLDDNYLEMKTNNNDEYTRLIAHACRIAVEVGADLIKTNYTGNTESFKRVIYSAGDVPVVIAGGSMVSEEDAILNVVGAMDAGAAGVCLGRNFFYRNDLLTFYNKVNDIINDY